MSEVGPHGLKIVYIFALRCGLLHEQFAWNSKIWNFFARKIPKCGPFCVRNSKMWILFVLGIPKCITFFVCEIITRVGALHTTCALDHGSIHVIDIYRYTNKKYTHNATEFHLWLRHIKQIVIFQRNTRSFQNVDYWEFMSKKATFYILGVKGPHFGKCMIEPP